jgi:hypothetical protein
MSFYEKYFLSAIAYGGIRKLIYTYDTKYTQKIGNKIEQRPILYSHRIVHCLFAGFMGIGLTPVYILNDIERLEMYIRNIKPFPQQCKYHTDVDFHTILFDYHRVE